MPNEMYEFGKIKKTYNLKRGSSFVSNPSIISLCFFVKPNVRTQIDWTMA
jgi:hypothetical protein